MEGIERKWQSTLERTNTDKFCKIFPKRRREME
jgi:hypothetical protein